jgi:protein-S-isoprenylcysteine O-methyltransferase Ste14
MRLPGGFLIATGAILYFGCLWDFTVTGRGTPAVWDPPVVFVSKGLYRFVRNPMYLAIVSILVGEALFFQSAVLGWMARLSLVCCVLRGKGLEATVWGL